MVVKIEKEDEMAFIIGWLVIGFLSGVGLIILDVLDRGKLTLVDLFYPILFSFIGFALTVQLLMTVYDRGQGIVLWRKK